MCLHRKNTYNTKQNKIYDGFSNTKQVVPKIFKNIKKILWFSKDNKEQKKQHKMKHKNETKNKVKKVKKI